MEEEMLGEHVFKWGKLCLSASEKNEIGNLT